MAEGDRMTVIGRWKITARMFGEPGGLVAGALDGQAIPPGESVIVVPEQQLQGAVADRERLTLALSAAVNDDNGWRAEALKVLGVEWDGDPRDLPRGQ